VDFTPALQVPGYSFFLFVSITANISDMDLPLFVDHEGALA